MRRVILVGSFVALVVSTATIPMILYGLSDRQGELKDLVGASIEIPFRRQVQFFQESYLWLVVPLVLLVLTISFVIARRSTGKLSIYINLAITALIWGAAMIVGAVLENKIVSELKAAGMI